jgi:hypothetical protein
MGLFRSLVPIVPVVHRDPRRYITDPLREILERTYWLDFQRRVDHDQLLGAVRTYLQKGACVLLVCSCACVFLFRGAWPGVCRVPAGSHAWSLLSQLLLR